MLSPSDGETMSSTGNSVHFEGFDYTSGTRVNIQVYNPSSRGFDPLTSATTGATPYSYDGSNWYYWTASQSIPSTYWRGGRKGGSYAKVRTLRSNGSSINSVRSDWETCQTQYPGVSEFIAHCASDQSPNANLYTTSYPRNVDLILDLILFAPSGTTLRVHNAGRAGRVTRAECSSIRRASTRTYSQRIDPGQTLDLAIGFTPSYYGERITCTVFGEDLEGHAEALTCTTSGGVTTCGDNSRTTVF
ncbi:MAG: hypothetical protein KC933_22745, partial [Myxococcales bacterium]|nr:hypothetical protein [Myxococcales bacterium]